MANQAMLRQCLSPDARSRKIGCQMRTFIEASAMQSR
ncbi:MAG: hypothetical protein OJF62_000323 [Pseudolabrys sp.]|jgi:hypothetical protein|nr:hypothetical protein [Pseudolabrys sp.]